MIDFCIIGAQKSGTTSLARYLEAHPAVYLAPVKEVHFFDRHYERGLDWYEQQFARAPEGARVGEATPMYLFEPAAAARLADAAPAARLIAILRNPVDRAYSHYWHTRARGHEPLELRDAIAAEPERLTSDDVEVRGRYAYVGKGRYFEQLERYAEHFPREQLHVALFDDLVSAPDALFAGVCAHLGVDVPAVAGIGRAHNPYRTKAPLAMRRLARWMPTPSLQRRVRRIGANDTGYPPLGEDDRSHLASLFADDVRRLSAWLDRDLTTTWLDAERSV